MDKVKQIFVKNSLFFYSWERGLARKYSICTCISARPIALLISTSTENCNFGHVSRIRKRNKFGAKFGLSLPGVKDSTNVRFIEAPSAGTPFSINTVN